MNNYLITRKTVFTTMPLGVGCESSSAFPCLSMASSVAVLSFLPCTCLHCCFVMCPGFNCGGFQNLNRTVALRKLYESRTDSMIPVVVHCWKWLKPSWLKSRSVGSKTLVRFVLYSDSYFSWNISSSLEGNFEKINFLSLLDAEAES